MSNTNSERYLVIPPISGLIYRGTVRCNGGSVVVVWGVPLDVMVVWREYRKMGGEKFEQKKVASPLWE